jgi:hypothetical protein
MESPESFSDHGWTQSFRALRADGSIRDLRVHAVLQRDVRGVPLRWTGSAQDVTEERLTQGELEALFLEVGGNGPGWTSNQRPTDYEADRKASGRSI